MFKIFWQSLFTLFLGFFVIVNVAMAFNMMNVLFTNPSLAYIDYSNKYLSFSNLIDFLKNQRLESSGFISNFQNFLNQLQSFIVARFDGSLWSRTDFEWWEYLLNVVSYLIVPIVLLVNVALYFIYLFVIALWVVIQFLRFMSGGFYSVMPPNSYDELNQPISSLVTLFV